MLLRSSCRGVTSRIVDEPGPRLFAGGNPRDNQTGGRGGAIVAVVMLVLGSGVAGLFGLFVFPYASDNCGDSETAFICVSAHRMNLSGSDSLT